LRRPSASKGPPAIQRRIKLQAATWKALVQGLEECVRSGTGQAATVEGIRVAGKTGTATVNHGGASHAWFVGFAPVDSPEVALVVFLERGTGARDAAPLAGRVLGHYFGLKSRRR
jgi:cell division protein FtsI/penicillin-binding protein 2